MPSHRWRARLGAPRKTATSLMWSSGHAGPKRGRARLSETKQLPKQLAVMSAAEVSETCPMLKKVQHASGELAAVAATIGRHHFPVLCGYVEAHFNEDMVKVEADRASRSGRSYPSECGDALPAKVGPMSSTRAPPSRTTAPRRPMMLTPPVDPLHSTPCHSL